MEPVKPAPLIHIQTQAKWSVCPILVSTDLYLEREESARSVKITLTLMSREKSVSLKLVQEGHMLM